MIKSNVTNPVAIELKPLHKTSGKRVKLEDVYDSMKKEFEKTGTNQIVKYLKAIDGTDYVVLTNLDEVYYFNREAVINFEPFYRGNFEEFIEDLRNIGDIWEVVRRKEDVIPKAELDKVFFEDLTAWHRMLSKLKCKVDNPSEAIIQLINKLTLEDYGLIPFKFIQDSYEEAFRMWLLKGVKKALEMFFKKIDEWFYLYYDTELFQRSILYKLVDDEDNLREFEKTLRMILGLTDWGMAFHRGLLYYNFRKIDEDVFGKAYETFLAERRKEQGIYYTPKEITRYMAEKNR